jgi:hypothetical protein
MMPFPEVLAIAMVVVVCGLLMAGYPVALTLGGVSLAFAGLGHIMGAMDIGLLNAWPQRIFGVMTNTVLLAIPLFIFMGVMLERSRIAEDLLETMGRLFGALPGGLGISVVLVGVLLAAAKAWLARPSPRLRQAHRRRYRGGDRDAGADPAARDRAGAARRSTQQFVSGGPTCQGHLRAGLDFGQRSVCRLDRSGADIGRALYSFSGRSRRSAARRDAADPA